MFKLRIEVSAPIMMMLGLCYPFFLLAQSRGIVLEAVNSKPTPFVQGVYRALVIGNNAYRDSGKRWPQLKTAVGDAKAMAGLLKAQYGFNDVHLLLNASRKQILNGLEDLSKKSQSNDSILVYYAGHGFLDKNTGKGYWIPVDVQGMDKSTFIRNSTVRDELSIIASRVKHTLLISDSCFSGSLLGSTLRGVFPDIQHERYYKKVANKKSVQIIAAGGMEFVDDNFQNSGHSPFTYFLLNELQLNDRTLITASELSSSVRKAVANNVKQVPASGVLQGVGDELGEFIFLNVNIQIDVQGIPKDKVKVTVRAAPVASAKPKSATEFEPVLFLPLPGF